MPKEKVEKKEDTVVDAFNANTQQVEEAVVTVDQNNEFLFTFEDGSFFKLPGDLSPDEIKEKLEIHEAHNKGKISAEEMERRRVENEKKLEDL